MLLVSVSVMAVVGFGFDDVVLLLDQGSSAWSAFGRSLPPL